MSTTAYDTARLELQSALDNWDFSSCFPATGYTLTKQVVTVPDWPMDLIKTIRAESNGMLSNPIISITLLRAPEERRTLGEYMGPGTVQGTSRFARRVLPMFSVDCWADMQTGGGKMVERLAAQVQACLFVNANALPTFRRLKCDASHVMYTDAAQLWQFPLTVEGMLVVSYDQ